ncbi:hypothetical protein DFH27DRAFT_202837 [Peziza echinospora]|nr:hypothetical protein DFH27DRAFT_202837 [Peziza echinospora]
MGGWMVGMGCLRRCCAANLRRRTRISLADDLLQMGRRETSPLVDSGLDPSGSCCASRCRAEIVRWAATLRAHKSGQRRPNRSDDGWLPCAAAGLAKGPNDCSHVACDRLTVCHRADHLTARGGLMILSTIQTSSQQDAEISRYIPNASRGLDLALEVVPSPHTSTLSDASGNVTPSSVTRCS